MYGDIGEQILITFALIILNGIFSMTELAIVSARKARLESLAEEGDKFFKQRLLPKVEVNELKL